jgi:ABC-type branched-subunit amino acid transport system ATPase component
VDLSVDAHTIHSVIGPNGAGKTTLFNCITGFVKASEGNILLDGASIVGQQPFRVAGHGLTRTFQNIRLFPGMTALENVLVGAHRRIRTSLPDLLFRPHKARAEEERLIAAAQELLSFVGLGGRGEEFAGNFAYGHQRRLEIARALLLEPTVLLLDEPMAGMNLAEKEELATLIKLICAKGTTILLIEHDIEIVQRLSDRITVLHHGETIADGDPDTVFADARVLNAYLGRETVDVKN